MASDPLRGERVVLEPLRAEHAPALRGMRRHPSVHRWWDDAPRGWPLEREPDLQKLAIVVDGAVAGFLQFHEEPDPDARHADVDVFLGPEHQDRGLGTEALGLAIRHLTQDRGHHRLTLTASTRNHRAIRVYERLGFRPVGVLRRSQRLHGEWTDELLMELVLEPRVG